MPSCYVCCFSARHIQAVGLSFHNISKKIRKRSIADKWLEFLLLPPTNMWPIKKWMEICLCSQHFEADDFCSRQAFRRVLSDNAVPTRNPPKDPGRFGALFSQGGKTNAVTSEIPLPTLEHKEEIIESLTLMLDDSHSDVQIEDEAEHTDPAFIDHNYLINVEFDEMQEYGDSEEIMKDLSRQMMLQDLKNDLCRLCGQKGFVLKPIFDPSSTEISDISLSAKIHMHLPFKVNADDVLPCHICSDCSIGLNRWHELYVTCVAADAVLKKTFGVESMMSSQEDCNHSANRDQDCVNPCVREADPLAGAGSHEDIAVVNAEFVIDSLNETQEENEILRSVCGMSTPIKLPNEDDLSVKEFKSIYSTVPLLRYKCKFCNELLQNPGMKKEHSKICRELFTICETCGRNVRRRNLMRHKYQYHKFIPHVCDKCGKLFKNGSFLKLHIDRMHEQEDLSPKYCCNLCCIAFSKIENYVTHQKKHKMGKIKTGYQIKEQPGGVYICPVCNGIFNDALSLVVHLTSKRKMKCPSCLKYVSNEKMLLVHKCNNNKYECRYCHKSFNFRMPCLVHERIHTGEKPVKCRICDKFVRNFSSRFKHELTHAPPHKCPICNKIFRKKCTYDDHLQLHKGNVFLCPICQNQFSSRSGVSKHVKKFHKSCETEVE